MPAVKGQDEPLAAARYQVVAEARQALVRLQDLGVGWLPLPPPAFLRPAAKPAPGAPARRGPGRPATQPPAPPAEPVAESCATLAELEAEVGRCPHCPHGEQPKLFGEGDPAAQVVLVTARPADPAAGAMWQAADRELLARMLEAIGLSLAGVYVTPVVKCGGDGGGGSFQPPEDCLVVLRRQLAVLRPLLVVSVGPEATGWLVGSDRSLFQLRGRTHRFAGLPLHPLFHPALLRRTPELKKTAWEDLQRIRNHLARLRRRTG